VAIGRRHLADRLQRHARVVASVVGGGKRGRQLPILTAVEAARTMVSLSDEVLHALVDEARSQGYTWQEIGDVLGTTRQAAFQRFGRAPGPQRRAL